MPKAWAPVGTGELVRAYLLAKEVAYPYECFRFMETILTTPGVRLAGKFVASRRGRVTRRTDEHREVVGTRQGYQLPSYLSTRRVFSNLHRLGVLEEPSLATVVRLRGANSGDHRIPASPHRPGTPLYGTRLKQNKHYYRIVQGREEDVAWRDSYEARYNPQYYRYVQQVPRERMSEQDVETVRVFVLEHRL